MSDSTTSEWTIKEDRLYHIPCEEEISLGMMLRHDSWKDGYCIVCGKDLPEKWVEKLYFIWAMETL